MTLVMGKAGPSNYVCMPHYIQSPAHSPNASSKSCDWECAACLWECQSCFGLIRSGCLVEVIGCFIRTVESHIFAILFRHFADQIYLWL